MAKKTTNQYMEFNDYTNKLRWVRFNSQRAEEYISYNELINLWSSDRSIKEYITSGATSMQVADYLIDMVLTDGDAHNEGFFYCFDKADDLVGCAYVIAPMEDDKYTHIEYVITNPRTRQKGIATRMVRSIVDNADRFTYGRHKGYICASVENSNEPSKKVFSNAGLEEVVPTTPTTSSVVNGRFDPLANRNKYTRYYLGKKGMEDEAEMADE